MAYYMCLQKKQVILLALAGILLALLLFAGGFVLGCTLCPFGPMADSLASRVKVTVKDSTKKADSMAGPKIDTVRTPLDPNSETDSVQVQPGMPPRVCVRGIDVSAADGTIKWTKVRQSGVVFAMIKATEGIDVIDAQFRFNWQESRGAGVVRGAYHYFDPELDPTAQATFFLDNLPLDSLDLPPILYIEITGGVDNATMVNRAKIWLDAVEDRLDRKPIIYTDPAFWNSHFTSKFGDYPLWVSDLFQSSARLPRGWSVWTFWQFSDSGRVDGIKGMVNLDWFNGTTRELKAFVKTDSLMILTSGGLY